MKNEILLSIICPVYNGEKVVGKMIESLESQNYKDYELILVNDGSSDNSLKVLKEYEKKYKNIIVIDKKHSGVSDTRNTGILHAKGKYISFGDCDDWYNNDFFEKIIPMIQVGKFELLFFNAYVIDNEKHMANFISQKYTTDCFKEENGIQKYLDGTFLHQLGSVPWNKVYLKSIIEKYQIKFDVNKKSGEDFLFNIWYVSKIKDYKFLNEKIYYYFDPNLITTKEYRPTDIKEITRYYEPIKNICLENNIKNWEHFLGLFYLRKFMGVILNESLNSDYKVGKENINNYLETLEIKNSLKKVKCKHLDKKLLFCLILYKLKLCKSFYFIYRHLKRKKI